MNRGIWFLLTFACLQANARVDIVKVSLKRGDCPLYYMTGPGGNCFKFSEKYRNWAAARAQCKTEGGDLANLQSNEDYDFAIRHLKLNPKSPKVIWRSVKKFENWKWKVYWYPNELGTDWDRGFWIGASERSRKFKWLNNDEKVTGRWLPGNPDNGWFGLIQTGAENCVQLMNYNSKKIKKGYNDYKCGKSTRFICKIDLEEKSRCPLDYVTGPHGDCYRFSEERKTYDHAAKQCEAEGAQLANTQSSEVYTFVSNYIKSNAAKATVKWLLKAVSILTSSWNNGWWIGAHKQDGAFKWINGVAVTTHWVKGMPDNGVVFGAESCVQQMDIGYNDDVCGKKLRFVCMVKKARNPCDEVNNCGGNGQCLVEAGKAFCACNQGWTGKHCGEKKCRFVVTRGGMPVKADVMVLLDGSGSVSSEDFQKSLSFIRDFADTMRIGSDAGRINVHQFSHTHQTEITFADSVELGEKQLKKKIDGLQQLGGGTFTGDALAEALRVFRESGRRDATDVAKYVLVLTDGETTSDQEDKIKETVPEITKIGVEILGIGIGGKVNQNQLLIMTGNRQDRVFSVDSFDKLNSDFLKKMVEKMCE